MEVLLVAEQNNELVMMNHQTRPTGAAPFPEANVASSSQNNGRGVDVDTVETEVVAVAVDVVGDKEKSTVPTNPTMKGIIKGLEQMITAEISKSKKKVFATDAA
ncbi:unnamed protein product [Microthlaspi erraticum]|uniref:Uncharacterized protein n=1 Tax=Microthlaspi erraticum TaxID=1685480 RepID=A0A6D2HLE4_9BRAS|nr:unnamed protein product [Microthlaspi erraticum]